MLEKLIYLLMVQTDHMDRLCQQTRRITLAINQEELDDFSRELSNRDRLLNLMKQLDNSLIELIETQSIPPDYVSILKSYSDEFTQMSHTINQIDGENYQKLELMREKISGEIGSLFKYKENLRGYNLSTVKR